MVFPEGLSVPLYFPIIFSSPHYQQHYFWHQEQEVWPQWPKSWSTPIRLSNSKEILRQNNRTFGCTNFCSVLWYWPKGNRSSKGVNGMKRYLRMRIADVIEWRIRRRRAQIVQDIVADYAWNSVPGRLYFWVCVPRLLRVQKTSQRNPSERR